MYVYVCDVLFKKKNNKEYIKKHIWENVRNKERKCMSAMEKETEDNKTKIRRRNLPSLSFSRFMLTLQIYRSILLISYSWEAFDEQEDR